MLLCSCNCFLAIEIQGMGQYDHCTRDGIWKRLLCCGTGAHRFFSVLTRVFQSHLIPFPSKGGTWPIPVPCPQSALTSPLSLSLSRCILDLRSSLNGFFLIDLSCLIFSNHIMTTSLVIVKVIVGSTHREIPQLQALPVNFMCPSLHLHSQ